MPATATTTTTARLAELERELARQRQALAEVAQILGPGPLLGPRSASVFAFKAPALARFLDEAQGAPLEHREVA